MPNKNSNLQRAKAAKNDEFYTQLCDVEVELQHYTEHFKGKVVYCNADDTTSAFWIYFHSRFSELGLARLIATYYRTDEPVYKLEYTGGNDDDPNAAKRTLLTGNGDFRSPECVEILNEADIVVTNPPFSLFREYIAQLIEHGKSFITIGNMNCITYKEIFPLLKTNKMWAGVNEKGGTRKGNSLSFIVADTYCGRTVEQNGLRVAQISAWWFTNLDIPKRHEPIDLIEHYNPKKYPKYDNYDAINVDKTLDIPCDFFPCWYSCPHASECKYAQTEGIEGAATCEQACNGEMGVPISYLDKHSPEQFEIIGNGGSYIGEDSVAPALYSSFLDAKNVKKKIFKRIIIRWLQKM